MEDVIVKHLIIAVFALLALAGTAQAGDVYVQGYTKRDGTYVRPHVRSSPDSSRANNYGPSYGVNMMSGAGRDADGDGIENRYDGDDDNDGLGDDSDSSQYGN